MIPSDIWVCHARNGLSGADRLALLAHLLGELGHLLHQRVALGEDLERQLGLAQLLHPLGRLFVDRRPDEGLKQGAVQAEVDLGDPANGGEAAFVLGIGLDDVAHVVEGARLEANDPVADDRVLIGRSAVLRVITASYRPGGRTSIRSMLEANSWCSFLAMPPETKMPRWPTLSCTDRRSSGRRPGCRGRCRRGRRSSRAPAAAG